jgi:hypothetical protein
MHRVVYQIQALIAATDGPSHRLDWHVFADATSSAFPRHGWPHPPLRGHRCLF